MYMQQTDRQTDGRTDGGLFGSRAIPILGPDIPTYTGKPEQQRFTMRSGVLTSNSSSQRSAITGRPLPIVQLVMVFPV